MPMVLLTRDDGVPFYINTAAIESLWPGYGDRIVDLRLLVDAEHPLYVKGEATAIAARINDAERRALGGGDR